MDNREYYRLLGLREGATREQIDNAYKDKMQKLKSADYADDPDYITKRTMRLRHAYSVLTGSSAPATREQKEARFERLKDALDGGEDTINDAREALQKKFRHIKRDRSEDREDQEEKGTSSVRKSSGKTAYRLGEDGTASRQWNRNKGTSGGAKGIKIFVIVVVAVIAISMIGTLAELVFSIFSDSSYDYYDDYDDYDDYDTEEYIQEVHDAVDYIYSVNSEYDFSRLLDTSEQEANQDQIEWTASDDTYAEMWDCAFDLTYALGIYSMSDAVEYITGDPDYYWEHDDLENALVLAGVMDPPSFEEVAGAVDLYSNATILDYGDYFRFLTSVAENQTVFAE